MKIASTIFIAMMATTLASAHEKEPLDCTPVSMGERLRIGGFAAGSPELGGPFLKALLENDAACNKQANLARQAALQRAAEYRRQAELKQANRQHFDALTNMIPSLIRGKCSEQERNNIQSKVDWQNSIVCATHLGNLKSAIAATDSAAAQERFEPTTMWEEAELNDELALSRIFGYNENDTLIVIAFEGESDTTKMIFISSESLLVAIPATEEH